MGNNKKRQDHGLSVRSQWDLGGLGPGGHEHEAKRTRARAAAAREHPRSSIIPRDPLCPGPGTPTQAINQHADLTALYQTLYTYTPGRDS